MTNKIERYCLPIERYCPRCDRWVLPREADTCPLCLEEVFGYGRVLLQESRDGMLAAGTEVVIRQPKRWFWQRGVLHWGACLNRFDGRRSKVAGVPLVDGRFAYHGKVCYLECHQHYLWQFKWLELVKEGA